MLKIRNYLVFGQKQSAYPIAIKRWQTQASTAGHTEEQLSKHESEWQQARPFEEIPKINTLALLMNMLPGGKYSKLDLTQLLLQMQKDYGDFFYMSGMLGRPPILTTHNPKDFETVFRNEGAWPIRPGNEAMRYHREHHKRDYFQDVKGLIPARGKPWGDFRTTVNPVLMQPKNVRLYFKKMSQVNQEFAERIRDIRDPHTLEAPADFEDYINRWTLESVSMVALDKQLGLLKGTGDNPKATQLFKSLKEFFEHSVDMEMKPSFWRYVETPLLKKLMKAFDNIQEICLGFVQEAMDRLDAEAKQGIVRAESEQSVLEKLLKIEKKIATVMAMDMLMAGVDTTTSTFTAALLTLAKNPEKQEKLRDEVMKVLPNKDSDFSEASMKNIPYLRSCIKESQRLYPLIVGNARITARDCVLSGYRVPANTYTSLVPLTLLKSETYYPSANEFLPERWLRSTDGAAANALKATNPFVFLPFGFGPRMCVGKRIVDMEMELGLARLIRNFRIEFNYPTENAFRSALISMPNIPLQFKFIDVPK